jgi:hypothetical protein
LEEIWEVLVVIEINGLEEIFGVVTEYVLLV